MRRFRVVGIDTRGRYAPDMHRAVRLPLLLFAALSLRIIWVGGYILAAGARDSASEADAIIVLGASILRDGEPSPVFAARLDHGIALYRQQIAPLLVMTGGVGEGAQLSESEVGRRYAIARKVPASAIAIEEISRTTRQNLVEAARILQERRAGDRVVLVSDPYHLYRAGQMAEDLGLQPLLSPTPHTRYRSVKTKLPFLLRELYFVHHYALTGR